MDPCDEKVIAAAKENGIADSTLHAAQNSPVYKFVKEWGLALPLHPEFRTLPMLFYVPPLLPVMAAVTGAKSAAQTSKLNEIGNPAPEDWLYDTSTAELWGTIAQARIPLKYLANLFSAGDTSKVEESLKKLMAVRVHRRSVTVGDIKKENVQSALRETGLDARTADDIYYLTSLAKFDDRFVIPAAHREQATEMMESTDKRRGSVGFGFKDGSAERGG